MKAGISLLFHIEGFPAKAAGIYCTDTGIYLEGVIDLEGSSDFQSMLKQFMEKIGVSVNLDMVPRLTVEQLWILWAQKQQKIGLGIRLEEGKEELGWIQVQSLLQEKRTEVYFCCTRRLYFGEIPIAGDWMAGLADSGIGQMKVCFDTQRNVQLSADIFLGKEKLQIMIPLGSEEENLFLKEQSGTIHWKNWKKTLGCVTILALGGAFSSGCLYLMIQAECRLGILTVSLEGLGVRIPFTDLKQICPVLTGIGLHIKSSFLEISGSFAKEQNKPSYSGQMVIRIRTFSFSLTGGYEQTSYTSVFAVGVVGVRLGNPCITITQIAVGFGYNRTLQIPEIDHLDEFALLRLMRKELTPAQAAEVMTAQRDCNWIAAGVEFVSYQMIKGHAVISLQMGEHCEADITGEAVMDFSLDSKAVLAHVVLLMKASFQPEQGLLSLQAQLGGESYLLSKDCRVTGQFAFYLWYGGVHQGDFVVTLGGYHRDFKKPEYYPDIAPLGITWQITDELLLQGNIYFALTPGCLMAGGTLQMLFDAGCVRAWCTARMDIMIGWNPYFYEFYTDISLGISVKVVFKRVSLEIGCSLHLWGPDFSGIAKIKLWIISFTISFIKSDVNSARKINWGTFCENYLPTQAEQTNDGATFQSCTIQIGNGMLLEEEKGKYQVRSDGLEVWIRTKMPLTAYQINDEPKKAAKEYNLGIYPCGMENLDSCLYITISGDVNAESIDWELVLEQVPCALWGNMQHQDALKRWKQETASAYTGLHMYIKQADYRVFPVVITLDKDESNQGQSIIVPVISGKSYEQESVYMELAKVNSERIKDRRNELIKELGVEKDVCFGEIWSDEEMLKDLFRQAPVLKTLGGRE